jgi:hypothetical protein
MNFLTSALDGGEWSASHPCRFTSREGTPSTRWSQTLWNPNIYYHVYKTTPLNNILWQTQFTPSYSLYLGKIKLSLWLTAHHTMKTYWGSGCIAPHILWPRHQMGWVVSFTPRPLYPQEKSTWYPLDRRLGGLRSPSGRGGEEKNSQPPPGIEPYNLDCPARSPALYRLSYHGRIHISIIL